MEDLPSSPGDQDNRKTTLKPPRPILGLLLKTWFEDIPHQLVQAWIDNPIRKLVHTRTIGRAIIQGPVGKDTPWTFSPQSVPRYTTGSPSPTVESEVVDHISSAQYHRVSDTLRLRQRY